jgi:hypothetical protein
MAKSSFYTGTALDPLDPPASAAASVGTGNDAAPSSFYKGNENYDAIETVLGAVRYDVAQTLTEDEQAQARDNIGTEIYGLLADPLSQFAATTSAQLAGVISDETGTGALVFAASPTLSGVPLAPTAAPGTSTTQIATTEYVEDAVAAGGGGVSDGDYGDITVSGSNTVWTIDNDVVTAAKLAALTSAELAGKVSDETGSGALVFAASPTLSGTPAAPTAAPGTNTTQIATTAFVEAAVAAGGGGVSDGDYGDITVSGSNTVWTIDADVVSNTKLANMAEATVKGRAVGAGAGDPTDLTAAQLVTLINTADGSGSLLDADLLDGQSSAFYATATSVSDHLADATAAHAASAISFSPAGGLAADDVQEALVELDTEKQPIDADLTAIASLATAAYGRSLLTLADATALAAEVDSFFLTPTEGNAAYQPLDADLTAIAALTTAAGGRSVLTLADPNADRIAFWDDSAGTFEWLTLGTNLSITGTTINAASAAVLADGDYGDITVSGTGTVFTIDADTVTYAKMQNVSATSRVLGRITALAGDVEELTGANVRTITGLATTDSPEFLALNIGAATDTTLTRVSAGVIAVEGVTLLTTATGQPLDADLTAIAALTTDAAGRGFLTLTDPGLDRIAGWDDSAGAAKFMALADLNTEASPTSGDYVLIYDAAGNLLKTDWANLPGGSAAAGGATTEVQYNNAGTLDGDPNFTWVAADGLTNLKHEAIGADAILGSIVYSPGDATNELTVAQATPLSVNEFISANLSGIQAIGSALTVNVKHTGVGNGGVAGFDSWITIDSTNAGNFSNALGLGGTLVNYGSGTIGNIYGLKFSAQDFGTGGVTQIYGIYADPQTYNTDPLTNMFGLSVGTYVDAGSGGATNAYGVHIFSGGAQPVTNVYGLYIEDMSGDGATISDNIRSKGASSKNVFEGDFLNEGHAAFGNNAVVDPSTQRTVVYLEEQFTGDFSGLLPMAINTFPTLTHTGAGVVTRFAAVNGEMYIGPGSTGDIQNAFGLLFFGLNDQSTSEITGKLVGCDAGFDHAGLGTVPIGIGGDFQFQSYDNGSGNPGIVTDAYGIRSRVTWYNGAGSITNAYTIYARATDGALGNTNYHGLYIEDHSGIGSAASNNITSKGASSKNLFEGTLDIGHATDTTLSRASAGVLAVEGNNILTTATGQPLDADLTAIAALTTDAAGRSILALTDPGADRIAFWDDSASSMAHLSLNGLAITGTVLSSVLQGHIFGLIMSNAADAANDITVSAGEATSESGTDLIVLAAPITKQLDAAWAVGTNAGGINTGAEAINTWYEVHLIKRPDTGVVDVMFTTTANRATLPASYTLQRRIGWIRNDGAGAILAFTQVDDYFTLTTQINDQSITATATAAAVTVTVPPSCVGRFRIASDSNTDNAVNQVTVFSEIVEGNVTPSDTTGISSIGVHDIAGSQASHMELRVSSTSQIEHDSSHTTNVVDISTFGWIDGRRRTSAT